MLFKSRVCNFQLYHDETVLYLNDMMMMSSLYQTNTISWSFIVFTLWNNSSTGACRSARIPSQSVFVFAPSCCVVREETVSTNVIVFGLIRRGDSNQRCTACKGMLIITTSMRLLIYSTPDMIRFVQIKVHDIWVQF